MSKRPSCVLAGIPWDESVDRTLNFNGVEKPYDGPVSDEPDDPSKPWVILRLAGGTHNGQLHTMPAECESWSCGKCGEVYL